MRKIIFFIATILFVISCAVDNNTTENTKIVIDDPVIENPIKEVPVVNDPKYPDDIEINLFDMEIFNEQRQLWQEQNLQNYSFHVAINSLIGSAEGVVIVEDGKVINSADITVFYDNSLFVLPLFNKFFAPVTDMYESIHEEREKMEDPDYLIDPDPKSYVSYVSAQIKYDESFQFPKEYQYVFAVKRNDGRYQPGNAIKYDVTISEFTILTDDIVTNLFDPEIFNEQKQLWLEQNLQNYSFRFALQQLSNGGYIERLVTVEDGKIINSADNYFPYDTKYNKLFAPITDIYEFIKEEIEKMEDYREKISDIEPVSRISAQIKYDELFHFPEHYGYVFIFLSEEGEKLAGHVPGYKIIISDFTIKD